MTASPVDAHDLNKLQRWHDSLSADSTTQFPVHAIFLVSGEDKTAHDIFRRFRSSFEAHTTEFHHLVIFGQHGFSSAAARLLPEFGLDDGSVPAMAVVTGPSVTTAYVVPLPDDDSEGGDGDWEGVLAQVEEAAEKGDGAPNLGSVPGVTRHDMAHESLLGMVRAVRESLG